MNGSAMNTIDKKEPADKAHPPRRGTYLAEAEAFWLETFRSPPSLPDLPLDRPRPKRRGFWRSVHREQISPDLCQAAVRTGERFGATPFATFFATFQVLIGRLANHTDIVVAVPVTSEGVALGGAPHAHYANTLALRVPFQFSAPFAEHLRAVHEHATQAFAFRDYAFDELVAKLDLPPAPGRLPLTELQFAFQHSVAVRPRGGPVPAVYPPEFVNFDITLAMIETDGGLQIDCGYDSEIFDAATIARWIGHFRTLLEAIAATPETPIGELPLNSADERR